MSDENMTKFGELKSRMNDLFEHNKTLFASYKSKHAEVVKLSKYIAELKDKLQLVNKDVSGKGNKCAKLVSQILEELNTLVTEKEDIRKAQETELTQLKEEQSSIMEKIAAPLPELPAPASALDPTAEVFVPLDPTAEVFEPKKLKMDGGYKKNKYVFAKRG